MVSLPWGCKFLLPSSPALNLFLAGVVTSCWLLYRPGLRGMVDVVFLFFAGLPEASCCSGIETWHSPLQTFRLLFSVLWSSWQGFAKVFHNLLSLGSLSFQHIWGSCACCSCLPSALPNTEPWCARCTVALPVLALPSLSSVLLVLSVESPNCLAALHPPDWANKRYRVVQLRSWSAWFEEDPELVGRQCQSWMVGKRVCSDGIPPDRQSF